MRDLSTAYVLRILWSLEDGVNDVAPSKRDALITECVSTLAARGVDVARVRELRAARDAR